ncbi:MAG: hypothetical protein B6244_05400 [Candidatus Cloacimonetes bacterium 4572_55]|nr:MAG: hypothetical protein B6244_05400 [Candidatus Cloacimonetes bacterium 4572_55]
MTIVKETLSQVSMARAVFFTPTHKEIPSFYRGNEFPESQINGISLVAQQTYRATLDKKLGLHDFFYMSTDTYRLFFRWIPAGLIGFIFDTTTSFPIVLDIIQGVAVKLDSFFQNELMTQQSHERLVIKFDQMIDVSEEALGLLGLKLTQTIVKDADIDQESLTVEDLQRFIRQMEKSAGLIVGPSRAAEMSNKMKKIMGK